MGVSEKSQVNKEPKGGEFEATHHKKWVIAGIQIRAPLKPIHITKKQRFSGDGSDDDDEWCSTTPTSEDSRIPAKAYPPPPPRKRKTAPARGYSYGGGGANAAKEFFCPPDLETVFIRRHVA